MENDKNLVVLDTLPRSALRDTRNGKYLTMNKTAKITIAGQPNNVTVNNNGAKPKTANKAGKRKNRKYRRGERRYKRNNKNNNKKLSLGAVINAVTTEYRAHLMDPFNTSPPSLGFTKGPAQTYACVLKRKSSPGALNALVGLNMGYFGVAGTSGAGAVDLATDGGGTFVSACSPYSNYTQANALFSNARPISGAIKVSYRCAGTSKAPKLYAGCLIGTTAASQWAGQTSDAVLSWPTSKEVSTDSVQVNWLPSDSDEIVDFLPTWMTALPVENNIAPYILLLGCPADITIYIDVVVHFQGQMLANQAYYNTNTNEGECRYVVNDIWTQYIHRGPLNPISVPTLPGSIHYAKYGGGMPSMPNVRNQAAEMPGESLFDTIRGYAPYAKSAYDAYRKYGSMGGSSGLMNFLALPGIHKQVCEDSDCKVALEDPALQASLACVEATLGKERSTTQPTVTVELHNNIKNKLQPLN